MGYEREAQKDYFRRLKFKFLEQEAKKSFLFSITGDVPQRVMPGENEALGGSIIEWFTDYRKGECGQESGPQGA